MTEQTVDGRRRSRLTSRRRAAVPPVVLIHGLGLSGALWDRVRDALGPGYRLVARRPARRGRAPGSSSASELTLGAVGRSTSRPWSRSSGSSGRRSSGTRSARASRSSYALERPDGVRGARADRRRGRTSPTWRRGCSRRRSGSRRWGSRPGSSEFWSAEPAVLGGLARARPRRSSTSTGSCCFETTRPPTSASAGRSPRRRASATGSARSASRRSSSWATSTTARCPSTDGSSRPTSPNATVAELARVGHTPPLEAPAETAGAIRAFLARLDARPGRRRRGSCAPTRRRGTRREGPFGHLDVRLGRRPRHGGDADLVRPVDLSEGRDAREPPTTRTPRRS